MFSIRMEVALDTDPLTRPGSGDWTRTDTTCPVRALSTSRGADIKTGDIEAGQAQATVGNQTRDLDPSYTGGAWYPDLTLRRRVRFLYDDGEGNTKVIWTGYLDRLPNSWDISATDGWVDVSAVDMLAILADRELPPSVLHQEIVDLGPVSYWPLSETQGTFADDVVGVHDGTYRRAVSNGSQILPFDERRKVEFNLPFKDDPTGQAMRVPGLGGSSTQTVSVWWYREPSEMNLAFTLWVQTSDATNPAPDGLVGYQMWFGVGHTGHMVVLLRDGTTRTGWSTENTNQPFGLHNFTLVLDSSLSSNQVIPYIDGELASWFQVDPDNPVDPFAAIDLDALAAGLVNGFAGYGMTSTASSNDSTFRANVADVAYFDRALDADEVRAIYDAGTVAWGGDTTSERLERILDAIGVDPDDRDITTGQEVCGPTFLGGNTLSYLRRLVATEGGALFVSADGKLTFAPPLPNDPTPLDVIGDAGCPYSDVTLDFSLDRMVNTATVTRENGVGQVQTNTSAVSAFGPRSVEINTLHGSPSGARSRAASLVVRNKDLRTQIRDVLLIGRRSDVPTSVSLDAEIGDPYTVTYQPPAGSAGSALVRVERIDHRFAPGEWTVRLGVDQQVVLPEFTWDTSDQGWDQSVWA